VIVIESPGDMDDLTDYINGTKSMTIDVYSPAAGIPVQITIEDPDMSTGQPFPTGRHSIWLDTTTVANQWETLTFQFDQQPDPTVADDECSYAVLLFNPNTNTSDTYHWDNFNGPEFDDPCASVVDDPNILEDFECQRHVSYEFNDGWFNEQANPDMSGINTSDRIGEIVRNAGVEFSALGGSLDQELDLTTDNQMTIQIWDPGAPSELIVSFQDNATPPNVVIEKLITTTSSSEWVEYNFDLSSITTPSATGIFRWVMLLNPGTMVGDSLFIDNWELDGFVSTGINERYADNAALQAWPNPFSNLLTMEFGLDKSENVQFVLSDVTGRVVATESRAFTAGTNQWQYTPSTDLPNGSYLVSLRSESMIATKNVVVNR